MLAGRPNGEARTRARELLAALDVEHRASAQPAELSGGEQQRVAIARALANQPPVILADEPTAPLDSERALAVIRILNRMAAQYRTAIIVVTHDEKIIPTFKRIYHIRDGKTFEEAGEGGRSTSGRWIDPTRGDSIGRACGRLTAHRRGLRAGKLPERPPGPTEVITMHEMSLAEGIRSIVDEAVSAQRLGRVRAVVLEIGELAAVEVEALAFCFDEVMRGSAAEARAWRCSAWRAAAGAPNVPAAWRCIGSTTPARGAAATG